MRDGLLGRALAIASVAVACGAFSGCSSGPCGTPRALVLGVEPQSVMSADHTYLSDAWTNGKGSDHLNVQTSDLQNHSDLAAAFSKVGFATQGANGWAFTDQGNAQSTSAESGRNFTIGTSLAGPFDAGFLNRSCSNGAWDERMLRFTERFTQLTPLGQALLDAGLLYRFQNGRPQTPWKGPSEELIRIMDYPNDNRFMKNESLKVVRFEGDALGFAWSSPEVSDTYTE